MYTELKEVRNGFIGDVRVLERKLEKRLHLPKGTCSVKEAEDTVKYYLQELYEKYTERIKEKSGHLDIDRLLERIGMDLFQVSYGMDHPCTTEDYFKGYKSTKEKVDRNNLKHAIEYFLQIFKDHVDYEITNYLYNEAQVLKDAVDRTDKYCDFQD